MITYFSDLKDIKSIHNPLADNATEMRSSGFFDVARNDQTPYFGTSLKKTLQNQGRIFCDDASKLFSISSGYVNLIMSFPFNLQDGVIYPARFSDKEYLLWGVNVGQEDIAPSGIGVFLTKDGIEFRVKTSGGSYALTDNQTTIFTDQSFEMEFLWDRAGITEVDESPTMLIRINNENIVGGIIPIVDDLDVNSSFYTDIGQSDPSGTNVFEDVQFQLLDNSYNLNNLPCMISRVMIEDGIPQQFTDVH
jgi:hypothetical protein